MPETADRWWDDLRHEAEVPPPPPPRTSKAPVIAGAAMAALSAAVVAWWASTPGQTYFDNPVISPPPPPAARAPAATADLEQVRRAYDQFTQVYADGGAPALARFTESCEQSLRADARILDFCLAFDLFAASVREEPAGEGEARRLSLAQSALPAGSAAEARLAEVRTLVRQVSGVPTPAERSPDAPPPAPPARPTVPSPKAAVPGPATPVIPNRAATPPVTKPARPAPATRRADPCRLKATPADRLVCANPTLSLQDRRMKQAYERALAAGADPLTIDRGQAEWRAVRNAARNRNEMSDLYARRIRELNEAAQAARNTPPT